MDYKEVEKSGSQSNFSKTGSSIDPIDYKVSMSENAKNKRHSKHTTKEIPILVKAEQKWTKVTTAPKSNDVAISKATNTEDDTKLDLNIDHVKVAMKTLKW